MRYIDSKLSCKSHQQAVGAAEERAGDAAAAVTAAAVSISTIEMICDLYNAYPL